MKPQPSPKAYSENEVVRLVWLAIFISVFSFLFYQRRGDVLLYGDAVAHINIARRVFDSQTPGPLQLGTVWLPLPHLLILPFIVWNTMWQNGLGGSIPSMAGFVLGTLGIFRLARTVLSHSGEPDEEAKIWSWLAALAYAGNPNLIYMQTTAMGESLYLAFFIWTVVYFVEFHRQKDQAKADRFLTKSGLCLAAACLTRYEGWFLAALMVVTVVALAFRGGKGAEQGTPIPSKPAVVRFVLIAAAAPALWLAYNAAVYRNPFEFVNGPYSARAIEARTSTVNPAKGNLVAAGSHFLKAAELNVAEPAWEGRVWLVLALAGALAAIFTARGRAALLLWAPLPFYALAVAYASVPIFVPPWWPFSSYNARYGLELLPAFAVFGPLGISFLAQFAFRMGRPKAESGGWAQFAAIVVWLGLMIASYGSIWKAGAACYREAATNMRGRVELDKQLAGWFQSFPPQSTLLMYLGEHSGALEQAGIPLRQVINEGNHRVWKQPVDPEGLWERALANPSAYADLVIGFEGDPVWKAAKAARLIELIEIHTTGQPPAAIFQGRRPERPAMTGNVR